MAFGQQHHRRERRRQGSLLVAAAIHLRLGVGWIAVVFVWTRDCRRCCGAWGAFFVRTRSHTNCAFLSGDDRCGVRRFCDAFSVGSLELSTASELGKTAS